MLGLITLDNGEDHTKPNTFGPRGLLSLNDAIDAALADDEIVAHRRHRQAVHPGGRRRPDLDRRRRAGRGPGRGRARPRGVPQAPGRRQAVVRVRQRPGARRRPRGRPALHLPDRHGQRARARPARGHARADPRLGRRLPRPEPGRRRQGGHPDRREPAQPGQDARRPGGVRLRARRRLLLRRRLPRAVAALGGRRPHRSGHRRAARDRPGRGLGRRPSPAASRSRWRRPAVPARRRRRRSS